MVDSITQVLLSPVGSGLVSAAVSSSLAVVSLFFTAVCLVSPEMNLRLAAMASLSAALPSSRAVLTPPLVLLCSPSTCLAAQRKFYSEHPLHRSRIVDMLNQKRKSRLTDGNRRVVIIILLLKSG